MLKDIITPTLSCGLLRGSKRVIVPRTKKDHVIKKSKKQQPVGVELETQQRPENGSKMGHFQMNLILGLEKC
jgi:hypothetical protein